MPSFETPEPISATVQLGAGAVQFLAADRVDTVVEVLPTDPGRDADVRLAEQTRVTYEGGRLHIKAPKQRSLFGRTPSVDVVVELPAGSQVESDAAWADFRAEGRLGETRVKTSSGDIQLAETGPLRLHTSYGRITVDHARGDVEAQTGFGNIRIRAVEGNVVLKNSHGTTTVGAVAGQARISGANGDIVVERAGTGLRATTAHGTLRVDEVARGSVELETSSGDIEIGVRAGTAAWLDASSGHGRVRNLLTASDTAGEAEDKVEVRARTRYGDIEVRRATA
ncbi:DUF4097 family beta strand repeat-containing protein [Streptomyces sp. DT24]|uniref:DUF4097 family beta strand repeat-containing protein n=1 Tax=unclassified Streptomyces TaxID=2593676 RepID=UPI0023B8CAD5|nr:DUF4097 family beta strand repeat-containing protein [Streptomyces sp. AM 4-1-1]WEH36144.1 DUF4097 family beta strand repeat-containing protein [Streptomyces sp. AM 4-1-1]